MQWGTVLEPYLVPDTLFGQAYEAVGDVRRSWLKTQIARLYSWYGRGPCDAGYRERRHAEGFMTCVSWQPPQWGVVCLDASVQSPAVLLSAVVPLIMTGCPEVVVIRHTDADWPASLLAALELAGIEYVAGVPASFAIQETLPAGPGTVISVGEQGRVAAQTIQSVSPGCRGVDHPDPKRLGLWNREQASWNTEALSWMYAGLSLDVWGRPVDDLSWATPLEGSWEMFCARSYDGVFVPKDRMRSAMAPGRLVLTPGFEYCWCDPELELASLGHRSLAWADTQATGEGI